MDAAHLGKRQHAPVWSPDGRRVAFSSNRAGDFGLYGLSAEGGEAERLTIGSSWWELSQAWSPDGRALAFSQQHGVTGHDLWVLPLEGERRPKPFLITRFAETGAVFSPDGRYLAYHSDESGRMDVYVRPYPGPGPRWIISPAGGQDPVWRRNGRELLYRTGTKGDRMMSVAVDARSTFDARPPRLRPGVRARRENPMASETAEGHRS